MMEKQIYVGESSFESMVEEKAYIVDKTRYIKSIFKDGNSVSLITRPRRFGKSLTQSMLKCFLELNYETPGDTAKPRRLFSGFEILKDEAFCRENLGQWPVIFLSLKKVIRLPDILTNKDKQPIKDGVAPQNQAWSGFGVALMTRLAQEL